MDKISLGLNDKKGQELFAGETVQIVNGAKSGTTLYNIRAAAKAFTLVGDMNAKDKSQGSLQIPGKKVMKVLPPKHERK